MPRSVKETYTIYSSYPHDREGNSVAAAPDPVPEDVIAKNIDYRQQVSTIVDQAPDQEICSQVLRDLLEKEQEFVSDLRGLLNQYLQPLHHADM